MLQRALEKAEVRNPVVTFTDGDDLLEFLNGKTRAYSCAPEDCSLLFLDLNMPRMTGFDVLAAMRRHGLANRLRTVVVSGSNRDEDADRAKQLGASEYLVKFPPPDVLAKIVAVACRKQPEPLRDGADMRTAFSRSDAA